MSEEIKYTDAQATDEAVLLLARKFRRLFPEQFKHIWLQLPEGAREAISAAENRADVLRADSNKYRYVLLDEKVEE